MSRLVSDVSKTRSERFKEYAIIPMIRGDFVLPPRQIPCLLDLGGDLDGCPDVNSNQRIDSRLSQIVQDCQGFLEAVRKIPPLIGLLPINRPIPPALLQCRNKVFGILSALAFVLAQSERCVLLDEAMFVRFDQFTTPNFVSLSDNLRGYPNCRFNRQSNRRTTSCMSFHGSTAIVASQIVRNTDGEFTTRIVVDCHGFLTSEPDGFPRFPVGLARCVVHSVINTVLISESMVLDLVFAKIDQCWSALMKIPQDPHRNHVQFAFFVLHTLRPHTVTAPELLTKIADLISEFFAEEYRNFPKTLEVVVDLPLALLF
jgi:hypothetical protein